MSTVHLSMMKLKRDRRGSFEQSFFIFPHMMNGLLKISLYIPTAPSISVFVIADVPITILSVILISISNRAKIIIKTLRIESK